MQYALPSDQDRYAMLTGNSGMYEGGSSQSMPSSSGGGYYAQPKPSRNYGNWQDAMTAEEMRTIGDDILDESGNPTGKKVYADWRIQPRPKSRRAEPTRYAGSGGGISGIPGGGLVSDADRYALLTGGNEYSNDRTPSSLSSDEDRYAILTGRGTSPAETSAYDSSNYSSDYEISPDEDRYALLTGRGTPSRDDGVWSGGSRDFDESTGTYRPGYRGLSSDEDRYALLYGSGGRGRTPANYSLSGLSSGLSSDEERYALLSGRSSPAQSEDEEMRNWIGDYERDGYYW